MHSTLNPKQTDPRHVMVARVDEKLASAHAQIAGELNPKQTDPRHVMVARGDEELARAVEQLSKLEHDAARHPSDPPTRMATFRPAVLGDRPSLGRRAVRGFTGLLLAACIGVPAIAWQSSYGDAAKQIIARWAPQLVLTSSLPLKKPELPAQPSPPTVQAAAKKAAPPQPAPLAQAAPEDVAPTAAAQSPELAQLLQSMARDLATVGRGIEQLKASQAQMARDNANAAEQLKASQEQMARVIAKASEQNLRPKTSAPPPRPISTPTRQRVPTLPSPQSGTGMKDQK